LISTRQFAQDFYCPSPLFFVKPVNPWQLGNAAQIKFKSGLWLRLQLRISFWISPFINLDYHTDQFHWYSIKMRTYHVQNCNPYFVFWESVYFYWFLAVLGPVLSLLWLFLTVYSDCFSGEPNNGGDEDCVQVYLTNSTTSGWNDAVCITRQYALCQHE
jgi:hypothetical protein